MYLQMEMDSARLASLPFQEGHSKASGSHGHTPYGHATSMTTRFQPANTISERLFGRPPLPRGSQPYSLSPLYFVCLRYTYIHYHSMYTTHFLLYTTLSILAPLQV